MDLVPYVFLIIGTLGILLFALTLTPVFRDREAAAIRARIIAVTMLAVGMTTFGITFALTR